MALELYAFKIYIFAWEVKCDLGGQRSIWQKDVDMIYKVDRKSLMLISNSFLDLWVFKVFILA